MSVLYFDSFDHYALTSPDIPKTLVKEYTCAFPNGGYPYLLSGRYSNYSLFFTSHQIDGYIKKQIPSLNTMSYFIFGFQFKKIGIQTTSEFSICFDEPSNAYRSQNKIKFNNNSFIFSTETQTSSAFGTINDEDWHHVEIKVPYPSPGTWQIYIDGTLIGSWTSTDTITWNKLISIRINQINSFTITGDASKGWCIDDFYVLDSFGSIYNNFVGIYARMEMLKPIQDYASSLTKVNTTNTYQSQDNIPVNNTQYIKAATASSLYSNCYYEQISTLREVGAVKQTSVVSVADASSKPGNFVFINDTNEVGPVFHKKADTYDPVSDYKSSIYNLNPATNTQWTKSNVNTFKYGVKVKPFNISITNVKDVLDNDLYYPGTAIPYSNQKFNYSAYILMFSSDAYTTLNSPDSRQWNTIDYGVTSGIVDGSGDPIYTRNYMLVKKQLNGTESSSLIAAQRSITNHSYAIMFITSSTDENFYSMNSITDGNGTRYFSNFTYQFSNDRYGILPIRIAAPIGGSSVTSMSIGGATDWTQISTGLNYGKFYYFTNVLQRLIYNDTTIYNYNVAMGGVCVAPTSFVTILLSK